jgi:hypothetical protein
MVPPPEPANARLPIYGRASFSQALALVFEVVVGLMMSRYP